jgi:hypothetical protein
MTMYKDPDPKWDTKEAAEMFRRAYEKEMTHPCINGVFDESTLSTFCRKTKSDCIGVRVCQFTPLFRARNLEIERRDR